MPLVADTAARMREALVRPPEWQNPRPEGTYDVVAISVRLSEVDRAVLDDETEGFVRMHERGRLPGCTIVAAHAGEMIGHVSYAMVRGATLNDNKGLTWHRGAARRPSHG
jgi:pyruvate/2-oxoglutarate dehydrogenase complex dihydrolipoamide dehydrogenase (E3) component